MDFADAPEHAGFRREFLSAEMADGAQRVLEMTVDYAKLRKCADMLVEVENAKSLTYHAAWHRERVASLLGA